MNPKLKLLLGGAALVAVLVLSAVLYKTLTKHYETQAPKPSASDDAQTPAPAQEPEPLLAPDFSMEDSEGNTVALSDLQGKPVVLNVWASWCPPCKAEMPDFETVFAELGEDVSFVMLNATDGGRETKETAQDFLDDQDYSFPVYYDTEQAMTYIYGVTSLPTTLFIDADGYLVTGARGMISEETLRECIAQIMPE